MTLYPPLPEPRWPDNALRGDAPRDGIYQAFAYDYPVGPQRVFLEGEPLPEPEWHDWWYWLLVRPLELL